MSEHAQSAVKPVNFLSMVVIFVLTMGFAIAGTLTLAAEPFCKEFGLLCDAGIVKLTLVGLCTSVALTVQAAVISYLTVRLTSTRE